MPFWLQDLGLQLSPFSFWFCALDMGAAVAWYVAAIFHILIFGLPADLLPCGGPGVGSLPGHHGSHARRSSSSSRTTSIIGGRIGWGSEVARRQSPDFDPSQPGGVGIQGSSETPVHRRWRRRETLGRSKPLGISNNYTKPYYLDGSFGNCQQRGQDEVHAHLRPGGRLRVPDCRRYGKSKVDAKIHRCNWRIALRGNRTHKRAAQCSLPTGTSVEQSTVRRFFGVYTFWKEDVSIHSVSHLHTEFRRNLLDAGSSRTSELHSVDRMFSCLESGHGNAGLYPHRSAPTVRDAHREAGQTIPSMLAPGGQCGRQGKVGSLSETAVEYYIGSSTRKDHTSRMGSSHPITPVQDAFGRPNLLGGERAQPSFGMAGTWLERTSEDAIRASCILGDNGWRAVIEGGEGTCFISDRVNYTYEETASKQRQKRSSQEEVESRSRRAFKIPRRSRRFIVKRKRKRERKSKRANLLFLEQWKSTMWWIGSWLCLPGKSGKNTQMFSVWLPWAPVQGVHPKVKQSARTAPADEAANHPSASGGDPSGKKLKDNKRRGDAGDGGDDKRRRGDPREKIIEDKRIPDFEEYLNGRTFTFVHPYSGREDRLSDAIRKEAQKRGVKVRTVSVDQLQGADLLGPQPFEEHLEMAKKGEIDGFHAGWPCTTFSRLRWRPSPSMPGPVRARWAPNGFASNTRSQQKECDEGTIMLARSLKIAEEVDLGRDKGAGSSFYTLENPPPSNHWEHISAWEMDETLRFIEAHHPLVVDFNTCYYEVDVEVGKRHFKPQRFAGSLRGLGSLKGHCHCGEAGHEPIIGASRSRASAAYPMQLAEDYAKLAVSHFLDIAKAEFLKMKVKIMEEHLTQMRARSIELGIQPITRPTSNEEGTTPARPSADLEGLTVHDWRGGEGKHETLKASRSKDEDPTKKMYLGGMRHPARVVRTMANAQSLGVRIGGAWDHMIDKRPEILEMAERYGADLESLPKELVEEWNETLKRIVNATESPPVRLKAKHEYQSSLDADLIEGWVKKVADPEVSVAQWARQGVPLGIEVPIPVHGIFPPSDEDAGDFMAEDSLACINRGELVNYSSVEKNVALADEELCRYEEKGYMARINVEEAEQIFNRRTVSKLALILKKREDNTLKKRIVIDLRRSNGNSKAHLPERLCLPRPLDCVEMVKDIYQASGVFHGDPNDRWGQEFILIDVTDAFMTMSVDKREWGHCLAPSTRENQLLMFTALLFGFKTAPLLYSRLAALVSRWLQSLVPPSLAAHQTYLDDSLWFMQGPLRERNRCLGLILFTMEAIGLKVAYNKSHRASTVQWIGVTFSIINRDEVILGLPSKFLEETLATLKSWSSKGYVPLKDLRSLAGRLSWVGGVLPRARWTVSVMYAVLKTELEKSHDHSSSSRRAPKAMFAVKRLEQARLWLISFLTEAINKPTRKFRLGRSNGAKVSITTDASPEGLGGYLVINNKVISAYASEVTQEDAGILGFELGQAASQGILESLALLVALKVWAAKIPPGPIELRFNSDSITALALFKKLSSSSPGLNFLGAELGIELERLQVEKLRGVHVPGAANDVADWLSRPSKWRSNSRPSSLRDIKVLTPKGRGSDFYHLPSPQSSPTLWGQAEEAPLHNAWEALRGWHVQSCLQKDLRGMYRSSLCWGGSFMF